MTVSDGYGSMATVSFYLDVYTALCCLKYYICFKFISIDYHTLYICFLLCQRVFFNRSVAV